MGILRELASSLGLIGKTTKDRRNNSVEIGDVVRVCLNLEKMCAELPGAPKELIEQDYSLFNDKKGKVIAFDKDEIEIDIEGKPVIFVQSELEKTSAEEVYYDYVIKLLCEECGKEFTTNTYWTDEEAIYHLEEIQPGDGGAECPDCGNEETLEILDVKNKGIHKDSKQADATQDGRRIADNYELEFYGVDGANVLIQWPGDQAIAERLCEDLQYVGLNPEFYYDEDDLMSGRAPISFEMRPPATDIDMKPLAKQAASSIYNIGDEIIALDTIYSGEGGVVAEPGDAGKVVEIIPNLLGGVNVVRIEFDNGLIGYVDFADEDKLITKYTDPTLSKKQADIPETIRVRYWDRYHQPLNIGAEVNIISKGMIGEVYDFDMGSVVIKLDAGFDVCLDTNDLEVIQNTLAVGLQSNKKLNKAILLKLLGVGNEDYIVTDKVDSTDEVPMVNLVESDDIDVTIPETDVDKVGSVVLYQDDSIVLATLNNGDFAVDNKSAGESTYYENINDAIEYITSSINLDLSNHEFCKQASLQIGDKVRIKDINGAVPAGSEGIVNVVYDSQLIEIYFEEQGVSVKCDISEIEKTGSKTATTPEELRALVDTEAANIRIDETANDVTVYVMADEGTKFVGFYRYKEAFDYVSDVIKIFGVMSSKTSDIYDYDKEGDFKQAEEFITAMDSEENTLNLGDVVFGNLGGQDTVGRIIMIAGSELEPVERSLGIIGWNDLNQNAEFRCFGYEVEKISESDFALILEEFSKNASKQAELFIQSCDTCKYVTLATTLSDTPLAPGTKWDIPDHSCDAGYETEAELNYGETCPGYEADEFTNVANNNYLGASASKEATYVAKEDEIIMAFDVKGNIGITLVSNPDGSYQVVLNEADTILYEIFPYDTETEAWDAYLNFTVGTTSSKQADYNGWTNWETWAVIMVLSEDDEFPYESAEDIKNHVAAWFNTFGKYGDITTQEELNNVNWQEIYTTSLPESDPDFDSGPPAMGSPEASKQSSYIVKDGETILDFKQVGNQEVTIVSEPDNTYNIVIQEIGLALYDIFPYDNIEQAVELFQNYNTPKVGE